jgi:hypothetical protein
MEAIILFIDTYVSISYILAVVFGTDVLNKFVPLFKKVDSRITALLVPAIIGIVFFFLQNPENTTLYAEKLFVSFLCAVAMYDFLVKPIKLYIEKKLNSLNDIETPNLNRNKNE